MRRFILLLITSFLFFSCGKDKPEVIDYKDVFIYYGAGYNDLGYALSSDINDIKRNTLPSKKSDKAVVIYFQRSGGSDYTTPRPSHLMWVYQDEGRIFCDTLKTYPSNIISASTECISQVLTDIDTKFKSQRYGMLFSSHATGHLPPKYLYSSEHKTQSKAMLTSEGIEYNYPLTKTIGAYYNGSASSSIEIEIDDFAKSIPFKLDYLMFDTCLMGGIEIAWALKDVCNYMVASPCEVLSEGFDYMNIISNLFSNTSPNLKSICLDYYEQYAPPQNSKDIYNSEYSATISLYDMSKIQSVKDAYSEIIYNNKDAYKSLQSPDNKQIDSIQSYFYAERYTKRYFYDLRDIAAVIDANEAQMAKLDAALSDFVVYHKETPAFFGTRLERCCGVSTYIPLETRPNLNDYYKTTSWNKAVKILE